MLGQGGPGLGSERVEMARLTAEDLEVGLIVLGGPNAFAPAVMDFEPGPVGFRLGVGSAALLAGVAGAFQCDQAGSPPRSCGAGRTGPVLGGQGVVLLAAALAGQRVFRAALPIGEAIYARPDGLTHRQSMSSPNGSTT